MLSQVTADLMARERKGVLPTVTHRRGVLALRKIFDEYDVDKSDSIDKRELILALRAQRQMSEESSGPDICTFGDSLFEVLDANSDGLIHFSELLRLMYPLADEKEMQRMLSWGTPSLEMPPFKLSIEQKQEIRAMFRRYDTDRSGTISLIELRKAMRRFGCNDEEAEAAFSAADTDGNGEIDFDEWTRHMSSLYATAPPLSDAMLYGPW